MNQSLSECLEDEAWQKVACELEDLLRQLVGSGDHVEFSPDLKLRAVRLKISYLRMQLGKLRANLQQHLLALDERLLRDAFDEDARNWLAQGAERLADMWLMESLLRRLVHPIVAEPATVAGFHLPTASSGSNPASESA